MSIVLYNLNASPPCRAVRIVAKLIGLNLELKPLNVLRGEHLKPEYLQLNPVHTVPTIVDDGFVLWESRAIMRYLVDMYAPDHSLYPKDVKKRATIERLLDFDIGTLYQSITDYFFSYLMRGKRKDAEKEEVFKKALQQLETLLGDKKYLTGNDITLADVAVMSSLTVPEAVRYNIAGYPKVKSWYEGLQRDLSLVNEINEKGIEEFRAAFQKDG